MVDGGELLLRIDSIIPDHGVRHQLRLPADIAVARVVRIVDKALGADAAGVVEQGADFLREGVRTRPAPSLSLAQGDFLPENILVDRGAIVGVIDWELARPAPAAFDLARWEVSAGAAWHDRSDLRRHGYARVADPESAVAGLVPASAVDWALESSAGRTPRHRPQFQRCVDVIARYAAA